MSAAPRRGRGKPPAGRRTGPKPSRGAPDRGRPQKGRATGQRGTTPVRADGDSARRSLGGEQVEGRHAVFELLLAGARRVREVVMAGDLDPAPIIDDIVQLADELKVPVR